MKAFQQPLSAEEEAQYLKLMKGTSTDLAKQARDILIERNLRLVAHVAKKYAGGGEDMDDLISIGTIGLIKAIQTYKDEKGSRLATYAARCIDNELLMMFRARKKAAREVSIYEPIGMDKEGNEINLLDVCELEQSDIVERLDCEEKSKVLYDLMNSVLDAREKNIIQLRFGIVLSKNMGYQRQYQEEMTQREIGRMLGISRSYVSRIEKKALFKLKMGLIQEGFQR